MNEAEAFLGDDTATAPEFMRKLEESLYEAPRFHQQQLLPLDAQEMQVPPAPGENERLHGHSPKTRPLDPGPHFRVEVWRETKKGQRKIRIIRL